MWKGRTAWDTRGCFCARPGPPRGWGCRRGRWRTTGSPARGRSSTGSAAGYATTSPTSTPGRRRGGEVRPARRAGHAGRRRLCAAASRPGGRRTGHAGGAPGFGRVGSVKSASAAAVRARRWRCGRARRRTRPGPWRGALRHAGPHRPRATLPSAGAGRARGRSRPDAEGGPARIGGEGAGRRWIDRVRAGLRDGTVAVHAAVPARGADAGCRLRGAWFRRMGRMAKTACPAAFAMAPRAVTGRLPGPCGSRRCAR